MKVAAYPTYDRYRDSGVVWIGKIPSHWTVKRAGFILDELNQRSKDGSEPLLSLSKVQGVIRRDSMAERGGQAESLVGYRVVSEGDIVVNRMQASNGLIAISKISGITSPDYAIYRVKNDAPMHADVVATLLQQVEYQGEIKRRVKGVMEGFIRLYSEDLFRLPLICAPLPEQCAIAAFLDDKCAKIDEAVRIKEAQIGLLRERRQILIQQAVTRGLNPDAPMKDSGIDWIGQIPAHWEVRRGKHLFREVNERSEEGTEELLSVSHMTGVTSRSEKNVYMFMAEDYSGSKLCKPGDIVINTMWAWMGALGVSDLTGIVSPSYGVYRPLRETSFNRRFLEWLLRTTPFIEQYNRISTGLHSSRLRLYPHMFLGLPIATPTREEQDAIVEFVENEAGKIDSVITIKQAQITTLKEYKTCLINAAVTGKIKVT